MRTLLIRSVIILLAVLLAGAVYIAIDQAGYQINWIKTALLAFVAWLIINGVINARRNAAARTAAFTAAGGAGVTPGVAPSPISAAATAAAGAAAGIPGATPPPSGGFWRTIDRLLGPLNTAERMLKIVMTIGILILCTENYYLSSYALNNPTDPAGLAQIGLGFWAFTVFVLLFYTKLDLLVIAWALGFDELTPLIKATVIYPLAMLLTAIFWIAVPVEHEPRTGYLIWILILCLAHTSIFVTTRLPVWLLRSIIAFLLALSVFSLYLPKDQPIWNRGGYLIGLSQDEKTLTLIAISIVIVIAFWQVKKRGLLKAALVFIVLFLFHDFFGRIYRTTMERLTPTMPQTISGGGVDRISNSQVPAGVQPSVYGARPTPGIARQIGAAASNFSCSPDREILDRKTILARAESESQAQIDASVPGSDPGPYRMILTPMLSTGGISMPSAAPTLIGTKPITRPNADFGTGTDAVNARIIVLADIDANGVPQNVCVKQADIINRGSFSSLGENLDEIAVNTMKQQWRFKPAELVYHDGKRVPKVMTATAEFGLYVP